MNDADDALVGLHCGFRVTGLQGEKPGWPVLEGNPAPAVRHRLFRAEIGDIG